MDQLAIVFTGVIAIYLTQDRRESWRRWACIFGLAGQPFWLHAAWNTGMTGMFVISVLYTLVWMRGVWTNWIKR